MHSTAGAMFFSYMEICFIVYTCYLYEIFIKGEMSMSKMYLYVSGWNEFVGEPGISLLDYNPENGEMRKIADVGEPTTFNCTALNQAKNILYITNEVKTNSDIKYVNGGGGLLYAFRIDPATGCLTRLSRVPACCPCPAYISVDPTGRYLVCANHSSYFCVTKAVQKEDGTWGYELVFDDATVDLFELNEDGTIGDLVDVSKHLGKKQNFTLHSRPHSAVWNPSGSFFACCDKGDDHIYMYAIDYGNKKLVNTCEPYEDVAESGPRYCVFHPTKPFFYANHENKMFVSAFRYDEKGALTLIHSVDVIPDGITLPQINGFVPGEKPAQQGLAMSADGQYLYDVVNGKDIDAIAVFEVDQESGALSEIQYQLVDGKWARGCAISPDGRFLLVSCLNGDGAVLSYRIGEDGKLTPTGFRASVPGGSYITFYEVKE